MLPYPTMPSRRPRTSWRPSADLSHSPSCIARSFSVSRRVSAMISARASSTTLRVLENGALNTATPRLVAPATSIWFVPMQKAPIAESCGAASRARSPTCVLERMPSRWTPSSAEISSSSSSAPRRLVTWYPAARSVWSASGWMPSSNSTFVSSGARGWVGVAVMGSSGSDGVVGGRSGAGAGCSDGAQDQWL